MSESPATLRDLALEAAGLAGETALDHWRRGITVERKADGSPVTDADRAAEQAVREWVERRFPADGLLGEEFGELRPGAGRRWIVDPIDGTKSFVRGVPLWGSLVALAEGETVLAGAAAFPAAGEWIAAARGAGCAWSGGTPRVSAIASLADATVLATDARFPGNRARREAWRSLAKGAALERTWGDAYGYLLVATARAEVMVDHRWAPWDAAALQVVIEEAGGVFTDWSGRPTAFGPDGIATNAALAAIVRERLGV